jgi:ABC-2 type transport system ATP-binding protein
MSIVAENITKTYGDQRALDNVSFSIGTGQIVGFLGPNGAGKSTMMKILTCYIPPSKGRALVCGLDVMEESMKVRKMVGYLPEHNPLYTDMYVKEYLRFVAGLHRIKQAKKRVEEMIDLVGLTIEQHKKIGALSKGYRQRVGLAQAMIHDPQVLILDEPTSGLDPNQLVDIRNLIRHLGEKKTVMLSTHIMQEVEAICHRVIIINRGVIAADQDTKSIREFQDARQVVSVEFDKPVSRTQLMKVDGVSEARDAGNNLWIVQSTGDADIRVALSQFAQQNNILILSLQKESRSMEDVFRQLTGK